VRQRAVVVAGAVVRLWLASAPCDIVEFGERDARFGKCAMSCQKGKPIRKAKPGDYRCKDCGFVTTKKKKVCKPKKVK
jgi:hypothetical protein